MQTKLLTALEGKNRFGWNVFRHTRDPKAKRRYVLLACVWVLLIAMVVFYVGALSWGFSTLGLAKIVPSYLILIASLLMLAFGLFKTAQTLFSAKGYDLLCSLPIRTERIVASRFLQLYLSDMGLSLLVMVPGCAVMGWMTRPGLTFYLGGLLSAVCMPVLPLLLSALIGTAIAAISSRMKRKVLAEIALTIALVVGVLAGSFGMAAVPEESLSLAALFSLADTLGRLIGRIYPPAEWLGMAMAEEKIGVICLYAAISLLGMAGLVMLTSRVFHPICRRLHSTSARHDYRMGTLEQKGLMRALWQRELRRYFASSVYVTNTIVGPIMGAIMAAALLIAGADAVIPAIPLPIDVRGLIPVVIAMAFTLMPPTAVSISMEGKPYWIVRSLPISRKQLMDAKLLLTLSLMAPFWLAAEILLFIVLRPAFAEALWMMAIPALLCLFAAIAGLTVNLHLGSTEWDSEVYVVKQSASAALGGFAGPLAAILCAAAMVLLPGRGTKPALCAALVITIWLMYRHIGKEA